MTVPSCQSSRIAISTVPISIGGSPPTLHSDPTLEESGVGMATSTAARNLDGRLRKVGGDLMIGGEVGETTDRERLRNGPRIPHAGSGPSTCWGGGSSFPESMYAMLIGLISVHAGRPLWPSTTSDLCIHVSHTPGFSPTAPFRTGGPMSFLDLRVRPPAAVLAP